MPRRSGGGGRMSAPRMPARPAPARQSNVPAPAPNRPSSSVAQPAPQQSSQPGLFGQMASTAAGVAVGSTVGHALGGALSGAFGGGSSQVDQSQAAPVDYQYQQPASYQQQQYQNPCEFELKQFLDCAQNQYDVSLCQGFNEALKQCKISNNIAM